MTHTFTARIGDVLGWDQEQCHVLLVAGMTKATQEWRSNRGAEVKVTVEFPEAKGQMELLK